MKYAGLIILFLIISFSGTAQNLDYDYESMLLAEEETLTGLAFKPVIGVGVGSFSFYGDVNDYFRVPFNGLTSTRVAISRNLGKSFDIEFHGTFGNIAGNQYSGDSSLRYNFKSSLFMGGASVYYNFNHIFKRKRPIQPYMSLGVEIIQFNPKGDIYNKNGKQYHYWADGTIRDEADQPGSNGNLLPRDYVYETDLRELNLEGYGEYSKTSLGLPVELGLNVTISDRVNCRFGAVAHLAFTDYIDNKTGASGWKNDVIINSYISLSVDMFSQDDEIAAVENFRNLKFTITDKVDEDNDGVDDFNDECPGTPANIKVTYKGCPEDSDKDGVPDYLDKQPDTPVGNFAIGANGIKIMDAQLIALLYDPDAVKRTEVKIYNRSSSASKNDTNATKGIPEKFKLVDENGDNYISHEELQKAIDDFFEMNSTLTAEDIAELQDFFFNQ